MPRMEMGPERLLTAAAEPVIFTPGLKLRSKWYPRGHPVHAYLRQLDSEGSRCIQASALSRSSSASLPGWCSAERRPATALPVPLAPDAKGGGDPDQRRHRRPGSGNGKALRAGHRQLHARCPPQEGWVLGYLSAD